MISLLPQYILSLIYVVFSSHICHLLIFLYKNLMLLSEVSQDKEGEVGANNREHPQM
jgi:hypothetical protein